MTPVYQVKIDHIGSLGLVPVIRWCEANIVLMAQAGWTVGSVIDKTMTFWRGEDATLFALRWL